MAPPKLQIWKAHYAHAISFLRGKPPKKQKKKKEMIIITPPKSPPIIFQSFKLPGRALPSPPRPTLWNIAEFGGNIG